MPKFADISVRILSDISSLRAGMTQAQGALGRLEASTRSLTGTMGLLKAAFAALGAGAAVRAMYQAGQYLDEMAKSARRLGMATGEFQRLALAAEYSGVSVEQASGAMGRLLARLGQGSTQAVEGLRALGLSMADIDADDMEGSLYRVLSALQSIPDPAQRAAVATDLFGRSGIQLVELAAGMDQARDAVDRLGIAFSDLTAQRVEVANDALTTLWASVRSFAAGLYADAAPVIQVMADGLADLVAMLNRARAGFNETAETAKSFSIALTPSEQPGSGFSDMARAMEEQSRELEPLRKRAEQIRESLMTPVERATLDALEGWGLWTRGLLDDDTMSRLDAKVREAYAEAAAAQQEELNRMVEQQQRAEEEMQRQWEDMVRGRLEALGVPELERELEGLTRAGVEAPRAPEVLGEAADPGAARFLGAQAVASAVNQQLLVQQRIAMLLEQIALRRQIAYAG